MDKLLQVSPKVYEGGIAKVLGKAEKRISPPRPPPQSKWEYEVGKSRFTTAVTEDSDEYLIVDYKLQLALNTTLIDGLKIWSIDNPNLTVKFDKKTNGLLVLDSWVPTSVLTGENSVESICKRGFTFENELHGFPFQAGALKPDVIKTRNSTYTTCVLCSVAVGTSLVAHDIEEVTEILRTRLFPNECDSLYIENEQNDVYSNTYRMFDTTQVLPRYIVRFASSSFTGQRSLQTGKSPTTVKREPASSIHSIINQELEDTIRNQITCISELLKKEEDEKIEDVIYESAEDSVVQLEKMAREKMEVLISEQMTLRLQLDTLEKYRKFISDQYDELPPHKFLRLREGINSILSTPANYARTRAPALDIIFPNLSVEGSFDVRNSFETRGPGGGSGILNAARSVELIDTSGVHTNDKSLQSPRKRWTGSNRDNFSVKIDTVQNPSEHANLHQHFEGDENDSADKQSSYFRDVIFDTCMKKLESFYLQEPSTAIKIPPRSARHIFSIKQQIEREKFNLRNDINKTNSARQPAPPPPKGKDGTKKGSKKDSNSNRDQTIIDAIPADQSSSISNLQQYNITPNAIESYQSGEPTRKSQSSGIVILDVLWANNMKGEEIYVGEDEIGDAEEDDNQSQPEISHDKRTEKSPAERAPISENLRNTSATYRRCQTVAKRFKRFKLSTESRRRKRRQEARAPTNLPREHVFLRSKILTVDKHEDLFWSIPVVGDDIYPSVKYVGRIFGGRDHVVKLQALLRDADCKSSLLLCQSGDYIFGGYASNIVPDDGTFSGDKSSFLFSITHGLKLPYHGRVVPDGWEKPHSDYTYGKDAIRGEEDLIQFGTGDLIISDDMLNCTSALENSYGFALPADVKRTFLAGRTSFAIDTLEVYRVGRQYEDDTVLDFESPKRKPSGLHIGNFDDPSDSDEWDDEHIDDHSGTYTGTTTTDDVTGTTSTGSRKGRATRNSIANARASLGSTTDSKASHTSNEFDSLPPPPSFDEEQHMHLPPPPTENHEMLSGIPPPPVENLRARFSVKSSLPAPAHIEPSANPREPAPRFSVAMQNRKSRVIPPTIEHDSTLLGPPPPPMHNDELPPPPAPRFSLTMQKRKSTAFRPPPPPTPQDDHVDVPPPPPPL